MYPTSGSTIRADINIKVEQAMNAERLFIGQRVLPPLPVAAKAGTYPKLEIASGELLTPGATVRTQSGSYGQITRKWTNDNYDCVDRGLEELVDDDVAKDMARFFNLEVSTARLLNRSIMLDHEIRCAEAVMSTTNFGSATNSAVAYTEANIATINFAKDVLDAIERVLDKGGNPNTIVLSDSVFNRLKRSTLLKEFLRGSIVGEIQEAINANSLAKAFMDHGITQVLIGRSRYNAGKKGAAFTVAKAWPNTYVWVGQVNPSASTPQDGGAGFTFHWNEAGGLLVAETYYSSERRSKVLRVRQNTTEKITDGTAGTLIATQWA